MKAISDNTPIQSATEPGSRYGRWTVINLHAIKRYVGKKIYNYRVWLCECNCDRHTRRPVTERDLRSGHSKSCGCLIAETTKKRATTHGEANTLTKSATAEYSTWNSMLNRCYNPKYKQYKDYGGRGITICDRWHDFANFLADMGRRPSKKHSINRIDNDGQYNLKNCEWTLALPQANNRRNTIFINNKPLADLARQHNISYHLLWKRLFVYKWKLQDALTLSPRK